jgi:hypothetical protein
MTMKVKVKYRFNKATGQVEVLEIDDWESTLPQDEHNREHDRIAAEIGNVVERDPRIIEVLPGAGPPPVDRETSGEPETSTRTERNKQAEQP